MRLCVGKMECKPHTGRGFVLFTAELPVLKTVPGTLQGLNKYIYIKIFFFNE